MMRELIVTEFVSLDGVMEAPGGEAGYVHSGWVADFFTDELGAYKLEEQLAAETLLLGRKTYDSFAGAWPERDDPFADKGQRHGEGRLPAVTEHGRHAIAPSDLERVRDDLYPTLEVPEEWQHFEDGEPVPNWVAAVALGRRGG
jgi:dihydrofolate reductase